MKYNIYFFLKFKVCCLWLAVLITVGACQVQDPQPDPNRAYFEIDSLTKMMIVPVTINDTVTAKMGFDTGSDFGRMDMDSIFCAAHPLHLWQQKPATVSRSGGVAWTNQRPQGDMLWYEKNFQVKIGETDIRYKWLTVWDQKGYFGENGEDGGFNMPVDTAHIWELNFEHNYIELHDTDTFTVPEGCLGIPIQLGFRGKRMFAKVPMKITTSDGDTLTINRDFMVDTGMGHDVVIAGPAEELSFFEGKDATPFYFVDDRCINRHVVDATVFDGFHMDSLRIYTLENRGRLPYNYLIGLNFLKRFNVFFDFRNMQMYLQPLKEFHRAFSPLWKRFDLNVSPTEKGSYIVTEVADHALNPYKKAGVLVGDEIVAIGGVTLAPDTSLEERKKLLETQKVIFDIIRNGKHITVTMERDPNDIQGD